VTRRAPSASAAGTARPKRPAPSAVTVPIAVASTRIGDDRLNAAEHGTALVVAGTTTAEDGRVVTLGLAGGTLGAIVSTARLRVAGTAGLPT
jgi:hypothetical protein